MPRPALVRIATPTAWRAILSPIRREIVESMHALGPCPIADVANACGRPADGLYRHVRILVKAGFLVDAGTRKGKRNVERLFDAAADDFSPPRLRRDSSAAEREAIAATAEALAKSTTRSMRASAAAGRLECQADRRNFHLQHHLTWLTADRFAEVRALLIRAYSRLEAGRRERTGDLYEVFAVATPVTRRRGSHTRPAVPAQPTKHPTPAARTARRRGHRR